MTTTQMKTPAAKGLALLSAAQRRSHPRAQVQSLRRIAVRALGQADRAIEYSGDYPRAALLRAKAEHALAACLYLNAAHDLGYPVQ